VASRRTGSTRRRRMGSSRRRMGSRRRRRRRRSRLSMRGKGTSTPGQRPPQRSIFLFLRRPLFLVLPRHIPPLPSAVFSSYPLLCVNPLFSAHCQYTVQEQMRKDSKLGRTAIRLDQNIKRLFNRPIPQDPILFLPKMTTLPPLIAGNDDDSVFIIRKAVDPDVCREFLRDPSILQELKDSRTIIINSAKDVNKTAGNTDKTRATHEWPGSPAGLAMKAAGDTVADRICKALGSHDVVGSAVLSSLGAQGCDSTNRQVCSLNNNNKLISFNIS